MNDPLQHIHQRRSVPARQLGLPAPSDQQLRQMLQAALHVPDHGKLTPWRLIVLRDAAKQEFGARLAQLALDKQPDMPAARQQKEQHRYSFAPLVVVVTVCVRESKVPAQEQILSAGCVAYNLLLGAQALGYGAQWLTGWAAYDADAAAVLGLGPDEHVIGFVHIGTPQVEVPPRERPALESVLSQWSPRPA